jgi:hypothetical protein
MNAEFDAALAYVTSQEYVKKTNDRSFIGAEVETTPEQVIDSGRWGVQFQMWKREDVERAVKIYKEQE